MRITPTSPALSSAPPAQSVLRPRASVATPWNVVGTLADPQLDEVSGVAASRTRPGVLWMHNDSGDSARVFAVDANGRTLQEVRVAGASAFDWEDIAIGPGRGGAPNWLYVADTGDNWFVRPTTSIYRFAEPAAGATQAVAERINIRYPDGKPRNVEAITVDPVDGALYLVSKLDLDGAAEVFRMPRAVLDGGGGATELAVRLPGVERFVTGADISADGAKIAITTYANVYEWSRPAGESVAQALQRPPVRRTPGTNAESIAYAPDGASLFAVPEGKNASVYQRATADRR